MSEEKQTSQENAIIEEKQEETKQSYDYRKEREERIKNRTEKAILGELGAKSFDEVKEALSSIDGYKNKITELEKEVSEGKLNHCRLQTLKAGIDEEFVDYVVDKLSKQVNEKQNFKTLLDKFKGEHPRYLRQSQIRVNTSSNFEGASKTHSFSEQFNDVIRKKITKER